MTADVTFCHPHYDNVYLRWGRFQDAAAGQDELKCANKAWFYLTKPNPHDESEENKARQESYLRRAVYYNVTGRTLRSLTGLAFATDPSLTLPQGIEGLSEDISGSGVTLFQQTQKTLGEVLLTGRAGLLTDYPDLEFGISSAQIEAMGILPSICAYKATDVINWRVAKVEGKWKLCLVVLREQVENGEEEGFGLIHEDCYRVLRLVPASTAVNAPFVYQVEIWECVESVLENGSKKNTWAITNTYQPKQGNGQPWTEIPFTFIGSQNNDWMVDEAPLGDIADLNLAHYRNSADYEDSVWFVGQPQFYIAGLTEEWRDKLMAEGMYVGSRSILPLPVGGSAGTIQANPNSLCKEAMETKEKQMASLGARIIQITYTVKTATQQDSEDAVSHSVLSLCAENVSAAYRKALAWAANFANVAPDDIEFTLSNEYTRSPLDSPTLTALLQAVQSNNMPQSDFFQQLRYAGYIAAEKTDEMIREEIAAQVPTGGVNLGDPAAAGASGDDPNAQNAGAGAGAY